MYTVRVVLIQVVEGLLLAGVMFLGPWAGAAITGEPFTVYTGQLSQISFYGLLEQAFICGIFSAAFFLVCMQSFKTVIFPLIMLVSCWLYYDMAGFLHFIGAVMIWIMTIVMILFGIIPAVVITCLFRSTTGQGIIFLSAVFGSITGYIIGAAVRNRLFYEMPWDV